MCPPKTDETKLDTIHSGAEIEVKPPENCLTHGLQVSTFKQILSYANSNENVECILYAQ